MGFWRGIKVNIVTAKWLIDYLSNLKAADAEISEQHFLFTSLRFLFSLPGLIPVSIQRLLRLPNGDESWRCVEDLTTLRHKSGKHQHQPWMNWVNGISTLQIVGESVVWGPWNPIVVRALCPETCCSRFIHLYLLQVGNWLPERQQHTDSECGHTYRDMLGIMLVCCAMAELTRNMYLKSTLPCH